MEIFDIDTPALLIDREILMDNLTTMQNLANRYEVALRPHIKTHKMPKIAQIQLELGACGIAVAKVGEAEVMAAHGMSDIFIANEIIGTGKLERIINLCKSAKITFGVDSHEGVMLAQQTFEQVGMMAQVLIEIEVGEGRSGICTMEAFCELVRYIQGQRNVELVGIFSHDGHTYSATDREDCFRLFTIAQQDTLVYAAAARDMGVNLHTVSVGSTPPFMMGFIPLPGVSEIRIGTYALMDASQGNAIETHKHCAATVLTTLISKPTPERLIFDCGAKALTAQERTKGICKTYGKGTVKGYNLPLDNVYDEHGILYNKELSAQLHIGDKLEIIPNHICPVCNLFDYAYLISNGEIVETLPISARGKMT